MQRSPDVIAIGAGPASLWSLIQAKLKNPRLDILIFEKRKEYARKHLLTIDKSSFKGAHDDPAFRDLYESFGTHIRTNELEAQLKEFATKLGINIEYQEIKDVEDLMAHYPDTKVFVGAAGRRDVMRQQIFKDEMREDSNLEHIAEIKYDVAGTTRGLYPIMEKVPLECHVKHLTEEKVGREKDGTTPVTLRFFINDDEYEQMQEARGGEYFTLNDEDKIPPMLKATIDNWLNARYKLAEEVRVVDSERITVTELGVYASKEFVKKNDRNQYCVLLGDAAFGVPFFRALNNALLCGSFLADCLALNKPLQEYVTFIEGLAASEIQSAKLKATGIDTVETFVKLGRGTLPVIGESSLTQASVKLFTPTLKRDVKRDCVERNALAKEEGAAAHTPKKSTSSCVMM